MYLFIRPVFNFSVNSRSMWWPLSDRCCPGLGSLQLTKYPHLPNSRFMLTSSFSRGWKKLDPKFVMCNYEYWEALEFQPFIHCTASYDHDAYVNFNTFFYWCPSNMVSVLLMSWSPKLHHQLHKVHLKEQPSISMYCLHLLSYSLL